MYFPQDGKIQIHQLRVTPCPTEFPAGYYWYGKKKQSPGRPAKCFEQLLSSPSRLGQNCGEQQPNESEATTSESEYDEKSDDEEEEADCEGSDHERNRKWIIKYTGITPNQTYGSQSILLTS